MTREEAIVILDNDISACLHGTEWGEALDMAIKALKQYGALQEIRQEISQVFADSSISNTDLSFGILAIIDKHIKEYEDETDN